MKNFEHIKTEIRENHVSDFMCDEYPVNIFKCLKCGILITEMREEVSGRHNHNHRCKGKENRILYIRGND